MQETRKFLLFFAVLIMMVTVTSVIYAASLIITVETNKAFYMVGEDITVHGNLTYNGSPVSDNTVGLQVKDPVDDVVVSRTLQTNASGGYNLTFGLLIDAKNGTYIVYVSSSYKGETATNNTTFLYGVPSPPVGGIYIPVNKLQLLAPYIGLTILLAVAVVTVGYVKKRKRNTEINPVHACMLKPFL